MRKSKTKLVTKTIDSYFLRGVVFSDVDLSKLRLTKGQVLNLVFEPHNPHDCNAVAVLLPNGTRLGYIPADKTYQIHDFVDEHGDDAAFRAVVRQFSPTNATHRMILVDVLVRHPEQPSETLSRGLAVPIPSF